MRLKIFVDGACRGNPGPSSTGVVIQDERGRTVREHCRAIGVETNNVAEYAALLDALNLAVELGADAVRVHSDSQLLVRQLNGQYRVRNPRLAGYLASIRKIASALREFEIVHVRREFNERADALANEALDARGFEKKKS